MNDQSYSVFNALTDIIAAPGKAFDEVRDRTNWLWVPLILSLIVGLGVAAYYTYWVDFDWLTEETIRALPDDAPPESADQIRQFMSPGVNLAFGAVAIVVFTFAIYAFQALYLFLINKVSTGAEIRYGQWFALSAWSWFVAVVSNLIALVVILTADNNQLNQHDLLPLSANQLIIHASPGEPWYAWGVSLSLVSLWTIALTAIGYARWTGAGLGKALVFALVPWVLIYGGWAALI